MRVTNTATVGPRTVDIVGTATPVDSAYGAGGAFVVSFPGTPSTAECPGPNYIVQGESCYEHGMKCITANVDAQIMPLIGQLCRHRSGTRCTY